jgi:mannose-1-phosphate guanylyltransferase/mannose-6-phosphate isomerase
MATTKIQPVLLCGGGGTRLWPLSTALKPKQFQKLAGAKTMFEETLDRFSDHADYGAPIVVGSLRHEHILADAAPLAQLVLEPFGRNSAPALAAAALAAEPEQLQLALPADHFIADVAAFHEVIRTATEAARSGQIVTFGITPDRPATGYGYIQAEPGAESVRSVSRFVEKPSRELAEQYIATGSYYWNAGIFLYRAEVLLAALERYAPDILIAVRSALPEGSARAVLDPEAFAECPSDSIDYAVMEHAENVCVAPVDMGWSDLGDHQAIYALGRSDDTLIKGPGAATDSRRCYVRSEGPPVALHGVDDLAVIATKDGVLVTPIDEAASIRPVVDAVTNGAYASQLSDETRTRLRSWLADDILPHWLKNAHDARTGGFVERLDLTGRPDADHARRGRVAPRQVFAFAAAMNADLDAEGRASDLVKIGLDYLDGPARSPKGGWAHGLDQSGRPDDSRRDLYDHAFVALAGSEAYRATRDPKARAIAEEAFDLIDTLFAAPDGLGWFDPETSDAPHRASNPHMHLLEAALAFHAATGEPSALDRAQQIATLFESSMFDYRSGAVLEVFNEDWSLPTDVPARVEPGHCYEWAVLLRALEQVSGRDTRSWRTRLIGFADRTGRRSDGLAWNAIDLTGAVLDAQSRLWPQLEMFRAKLLHPETASPGEADDIARTILDRYLRPGPAGGWIDALDATGQPASRHVPASMVYHMLTAFGPLAEK